MFPQPLRDFPGQRWVRIGVRTWHLAAMGYLLGGTALGVPLEAQQAALAWTFASGLAFIGLELYCSCIWLLQLKGWAVIAKMALFGAAILSQAHGLPFFLAALVIGSISSHMPGRFRYYSVWHGRVVKE